MMDSKIGELKKAIQAHYAKEHPELVKEIDKNLAKLDGIVGKLDHRLADSLTKASAAGNDAAQKAELQASKGILAEYIKFVKSEPLIAHMDSNPFGVKTNLKQLSWRASRRWPRPSVELAQRVNQKCRTARKGPAPRTRKRERYLMSEEHDSWLGEVLGVTWFDSPKPPPATQLQAPGRAPVRDGGRRLRRPIFDWRNYFPN